MNVKRATLDEIIHVVGEPAALELVKQIGGANFYFPPDGAISEHVTLEPKIWLAVCKHFAGWAYVPNCKMHGINQRDIKIRAEFTSGARLIDLVKRYKLSERRIRQIAKGVAPKNIAKTI